MGRLIIHDVMMAVALCPCPAAATPRTVALTSASTQVAFRAYGLGIVERGQWTATGRMRRAKWDMGARPLLAGPEVRIRFTAALPAGMFAPP